MIPKIIHFLLLLISLTHLVKKWRNILGYVICSENVEFALVCNVLIGVLQGHEDTYIFKRQGHISASKPVYESVTYFH